MGKKIFSASFPGIEVRVVEQKRLPDCRPEFRCFYKPGFKRVSMKILPNHPHIDEQEMYFDLVRPSHLYNVVVKESDTAHLHIMYPDEVIVEIGHRHLRDRFGNDCEAIGVILQSLYCGRRLVPYHFKYADQKKSAL